MQRVTGYVRTIKGAVNRLVGAPNTRVDVRRWRRAFELAALNVKAAGVSQTATQLRQILAAKPQNYFYDGVTSAGESLDAAQEAFERRFVDAEAEVILQSFVDRI